MPVGGSPATVSAQVEHQAATVGALQLRSVDTGELVRSFPKGHQVWLAGDAALITGPTAGGCVLEVVRTGRASPPPAPVDCWLSKSLERGSIDDGYGRRTGDALWSELTEDGSAYAVDLNTGKVRTLPGYQSYAARPMFEKSKPPLLIGAGVQVESSTDEVITRDAATGAPLWRLGLPATQVHTIIAHDRLVVVLHKHTMVLCHEWFAPQDRETLALRAFDARSGELLYKARYQSTRRSDPVIVGDRVLTLLPDKDGDTSGWLLKRSG